MEINLPDEMEGTVKIAVEDWFTLYDEAQKAIDRIPWTRKMSRQERLDLAMEYSLGGFQGWSRFIQDMLASGMTYEAAIKELVGLWEDFNGSLAKDGIAFPAQEMPDGGPSAAI